MPAALPHSKDRHGKDPHGKDRRSLERGLMRLQKRLPFARRWLRRLTGPANRRPRLIAGTVFVIGGLLGFLPILGFWMLPIGLALLALEVPRLRKPMRRALVVAERRWRRRRAARR